MTRISSTHFHLDTSAFQHDVAHLFEHLLILGFYSDMVKHGYSPALFGWIKGESFNTDTFIDGYFYDPNVNDLFKNYLRQAPKFERDAIEHNLHVIQAEDKITYTVADGAELQNELHRLSSLARGDVMLNNHAKGAKLLTYKRNASAFREVTLEIYAEDLSEEQQKLFLRLYVMLIDVIYWALQRDFAGYPMGASFPAAGGNQIGYMQKFTFERKGLTLKRIQKTILDELAAFDLNKIYSEMRKHFAIYATEPLWQDLQVEYFRHTGFTTTNEEVAGLATKENISKILSKLQIYARNSLPQDKKHLF